ncbi:DUF2917 domain-containing protein [Chitinilyticum piscinae]|uniref:DUF2917 domain-containing protein n=1 Tax=Chitinilyticum piscinae TaxID=2866724 RepID=A0A8J7FIF9_9NEIS|nr:DUF2917 domain-containing protein [Chitinilyticum piscinae]MBE9607992.1 DUF2917 domain-containing protein [Chitinilyticum piscinae]
MTTPYLRLDLLPHELLIAELRQPAALLCQSGTAWISSSAVRADLVLDAGERTELAAGQLLVEGPATLQFSGEPLQLIPRIRSRHA